MTRVQPTDEEGKFIGPYPPISGYGPYPKRLRGLGLGSRTLKQLKDRMLVG
ncbi:hypothetical protein [Streptomyces sp. DW26H14]|uniref:hypothetical protein n=1 Tax=Streptomyces sp. DW26H14 TaxID=3435395 RepID=UPI00403DFB06